MPFTVSPRTEPRIPGEFQIEPAGNHVPTDPERAAVDGITRAVAQLADQAAVDEKAKIRESLRTARTAFRTAQLAELRGVADEFANAALKAAEAAARCNEIAGRTKDNVPDVTLAAAAPPRFEGEPVVKRNNFALDAGEQAYVDEQRELLDILATHEAADSRETADGKARYSKAEMEVRRAQRAEAIVRLKNNFSSWKEGTTSRIATANVSYTRGYYAAQRARLERKLFTVDPVPGTGDDANFNVELKIGVTRGLPAPNDTPSQDQSDLYVEINRAETVISVVCRQIRARARSAEENKRGLRLLGEYIDKLVGIGKVGLEGPQTALAKLALDNLRKEFVAREAREILNRYVRRLGAWSGGFAAFFFLIYILVRNYACTGSAPCTSWWDAHRSFLLAAAGASLGTWASFSVRQVTLTFEQLAAPEEELLDAPLRVIFVVVLTMAACLLFWTGAINLKIGELNTEAVSFSKIGTVAILVGFFCGLSERALSSAIAGRATAFIGGIAGGR